ncbi:peptide/nickel transport system permease protein [Streptoalloteichus tenebrarius]|uniref:Peptide/nickel transport system permease protein n=1 Tax=Streptoalloteichus tenebrarius (strain ATCC 17920 / DSM 40477 / JCM 4838 / CBS 697.72 / NBRC 16177 / NCIMB 11028 / NRRL B-12390 / A12253. 1 / ISP 5477) TaxID=1933 RepID=A0ABT1I362_STRSD|nr:ABC transporter permease [Streptoalloteichus tenebrarius]MCP2262227.1 peptide/nickel transport system permease protein [Streptoalloteichus tenebrarius]BFF01091.1 ABC transporter permease [Streptoalloteichus tenebrarius]
MIRYIIRRLLIAIPILLVGTFLSFVLVASLGDPLAELRSKPGVTEADVQALAQSLQLDRPIVARYWSWLTNFVQGDWGTSVALGSARADVYSVVTDALVVTAQLVIFAQVLALVLGVAVGVLAAVRQYSIFDYTATSLAFLAFSMPVFCVAIILKSYGIEFNNLLTSVGADRWLTTAGPPTGGFSGGFGEVVFKYTGTFLLPTLSLMLISFAAYSRFQRASMLETLHSDYVRTARAKGLSQGRVIFRHAFRNALIPVVTLAALNIGQVFTGAIMTEQVFGWNGMGSVLVNAVRQYDPNMLMGWLVVVAISVVVFNLVADVLYAYLDPRIRLG